MIWEPRTPSLYHAAMTRRFASLGILLAFFTVAACDKDKKEGEDAAAEAAVAVVDAAPEAEAPVVSAAPLATPPPVVRTPPKPKPDPEICVAARAAKARKSPAAVNLEVQCKAAGGTM